MYLTFAVRQCINLQPQPYYEVYDSDEYAQARFFLLDRMEPPAPPPLVESPPLPPLMLASPPPAPLSSPPEASRKLQSLADGCWSSVPAAEQPDPGLDRLWPHVPLSHAESPGDADPTGHARHLMVTNTITTPTERGGPDRWELPKNTTGDVLCYCPRDLNPHFPVRGALLAAKESTDELAGAWLQGSSSIFSLLRPLTHFTNCTTGSYSFIPAF